MPWPRLRRYAFKDWGAAADRPRNLRDQATPPALALSQVWRPDGDHRETHRCPNPTPFSSTVGDHCRMKSFAPARELSVFHHASPPCALRPIQSLLMAPSHPSPPTVLPFCHLPDVCCYLLRLPTPLRAPQQTPSTFIQFAQRPRGRRRAASFSRLYRNARQRVSPPSPWR